LVGSLLAIVMPAEKLPGAVGANFTLMVRA
jgi:hypothetical protein